MRTAHTLVLAAGHSLLGKHKTNAVSILRLLVRSSIRHCPWTSDPSLPSGERWLDSFFYVSCVGLCLNQRDGGHTPFWPSTCVQSCLYGTLEVHCGDPFLFYARSK